MNFKGGGQGLVSLVLEMDMERMTHLAGVVLSPEWVKGLLYWMQHTGWSRLVHLLAVAATCLAILLAVFSFNLLGDGIRDVVDPKLAS